MKNARVLWLYTKYQLVSKIFVVLIAVPLSRFIVGALVHASGRTSLSSGDYLDFFLSIYGLPVILLAIPFLITIFGVDIATFVFLGALVEEDTTRVRMRDVFRASLRSLKLFYSPIGVFLVLFVALIFPLIGSGIALGPLKNFKIPNFITSVIFSSPLYTIAYGAVILLAGVVAVIYIFTLHFALLAKNSLSEAMTNSRILIARHWKRFLRDYFLAILRIILVTVGFVLIVIALTTLISTFIATYVSDTTLITIFLMLTLAELFAYVSFILVPLLITALTRLFYRFNAQEGVTIHQPLDLDAEVFAHDSQQPMKVRTKIQLVAIFVVITAGNLGIAYFAERDFEEVFATNTNIDIVAHRGGGDLGAENTVQGVEQAIKHGAQWTEIDVQRTKDQHYIVNHDSSFERVSGVSKKPSELTLEEIAKLRVNNEFFPDEPPQPVATLTDILDAAKNKIGVFIELKGSDADHQMVDDVVKLVQANAMEDHVVIISLDYDLITYTEEKYPHIQTGFVYFFATGDLSELVGDYLIMEEGQASEERIMQAQDAGRKAFVWTVNTEESIQKFSQSNADGIITDHVVELQDAMTRAQQRTPIEIIIDAFF